MNQFVPPFYFQSTPVGVMFHHFHGGQFSKSQGSITAEELERIILSLSNYRVISPDEWFYKTKNCSFEGSEVCLTFDDNLKCQYEIAVPILDKFNIKAFWFIYTSPFQGKLEKLEIYRKFRQEYFSEIDSFYCLFFDRFQRDCPDEFRIFLESDFQPERYLPEYFYLSPLDKKFRFVRDEVLGSVLYFKLMDALIVGRGLKQSDLAKDLWMTKKEVQALANDGHHIGLHTHTHPTKLSALSRADQQIEFEMNSVQIEKITGNVPMAVSFPNNSYSKMTLDVMKKMGVDTCFSAIPAPQITSDGVIPRYNHMAIHQFLIDQSH